MNPQKRASQEETETENYREFLTTFAAGQSFGIPILQIQDVIADQAVTKIPLAPKEILGSLNLRGRIVTAIDIRQSLGIAEDESDKKEKTHRMGVVVEYHNELYSLVVDGVGDVLNLPDSQYESIPPTLNPLWRNVSDGIYRLKDNLLIILDVPKLLEIINAEHKK